METDTWLSGASRWDSFSGSVLVSQRGKTLLSSGYGNADRERRRPNTPRTTFQIASISKQFAAAAVLLLEERGGLCVHDHIGAWVPDCPEQWKPVTVHHLLTHTSGIGHWNDFPDLSLFEPKSRNEVIRIFQRDPLKFDPGSDWAYSSPGYVLVAHIVEQVSGEPYASFLLDQIFRPLGMESTGAGNHAPRREQEAIGYSEGKPSPSFDLDSISIGAGDIWSTTEDTERWDAALAGKRLLGEESHRRMFTPHAGTPDTFPGTTDLGYGYGWSINDLRGHRMVFHTGDNAGFSSINIWLPHDHAIVVLLSNDECNLRDISMGIMRELLA